MKYLNPYTDFGFKKLFGEEANKDLSMDFLNQLLPPRHQIAELQLKNPEQLPDLPWERKAIFDLHCVSASGERFIVEMQKAKLHFFKDRSLFYVTFPIREQAQKGDWIYQLSPVYFIAILDFEYDEAEERRKFLREVSLRDQDGAVFSDKLHFKFLQMPLFTKQERELETCFDKWVYFLKNLESLDHIPAILNEPVFQKAFHIAELANLTQEQSLAYQKNLMNYWDDKAALVTARDEGLAEGMEKGREEGREAGARQKALEIARALKASGLAAEANAQATGLGLEDIGRL
jgi:predicted transposase/invertase (TIGR01784 family)